MYASIRTLLTGIVDYAGTFPPASLPLDQSLRNYAQYRQEPEAWMLGRFICPASSLQELAPLVQEVTLPDRTISFSVLGRGGKDAQEFFKNIELDLEELKAFAGACPGLVITDAYEVKLPPAIFDPIKPHQIGASIATMAFLLEKSGIALTPFVEIPVPTRENLQAALMALAEDQRSSEASQRQITGPCGLKLRTGGLEPAAFPSTEIIAAVLVGCRKAQIPFKATAGLHRPFRHQDAAVGAKMHGFINVFFAGCLSHALDVPVGDIQAVLEEQEGRQFLPDAIGITWRQHRVSNEQIAAARKEFTSFGSCSFDEPREDLRRIGWLA